MVPTYEYECAACGHTFEAIQSFHDRPQSRCSQCGGKVRKLFHPAGIIFRGSGWYATDSRSSAEQQKFQNDGKEPASTPSEPVKAKPGKESSSKDD